METITIQAELKEARKKSVWLTLDVNGESVSLWFQRSKATRNDDGTWTISQKALDKALAERQEYLEYRQEQRSTLLTFAAGSFGVCKNGAYWIKTKGYSEGIDRPIKTDLAFVPAADVTDNGDGTISVNQWAANKAIDKAWSSTQYRTNYACDTIDFVGLIG